MEIDIPVFYYELITPNSDKLYTDTDSCSLYIVQKLIYMGLVKRAHEIFQYCICMCIPWQNIFRFW